MGEYKGELTAGFIHHSDPIAEFRMDNGTFWDDGTVIRFRHCDNKIEVTSNVPLVLRIKGQVIARIKVPDDEPLIISDT